MRASTAARAAAPTCSCRATRPSSSSPRRSAVPRSSSTPRATSARPGAGASGSGGCASTGRSGCRSTSRSSGSSCGPTCAARARRGRSARRRPDDPAPPQRPPRKGTAPRIDTADVAKRVRRTEHTLLAYCGADGYPVVLPVELGVSGRGRHRAALGSGAAAGRAARRPARAFLSPAARRPRHPLSTRAGSRAAATPRTPQAGYRAPPNKTFLLLLNGLLAKRGVRQARKAGKLP